MRIMGTAVWLLTGVGSWGKSLFSRGARAGFAPRVSVPVPCFVLEGLEPRTMMHAELPPPNLPWRELPGEVLVADAQAAPGKTEGDGKDQRTGEEQLDPRDVVG